MALFPCSRFAITNIEILGKGKYFFKEKTLPPDLDFGKERGKEEKEP